MTEAHAGPRDAPAFRIRPADAADATRLAAIEDAADQLFLDRFGSAGWEPAPSGAERLAAPGFLLAAVLTDRDEVVGFAHVLEPVLERGALAHLEQVSVLPAHGRRGVGRALVEGAMAEAAARGHRRMTLRTFADVPWNGPFYARIGFVESEADDPFRRALADAEERAGLHRHGRRVQMSIDLRPDRPRPATA